MKPLRRLCEFPESLHTRLDQEVVKARHVKLMEDALEAINSDMDPDLMMLLPWYPKVVEGLLSRGDISDKMATALAVDSPAAASRAVIADYSNPVSRQIELVMLPRADFSARLLVWARREKTSIRYVPELYMMAVYSDFYWASYYHMRCPEPKFFEEMFKYHHKTKELSGQARLFNHVFRGTVPSGSELRELSSDLNIAVQCALAYPELDEEQLTALLVDAATKPQWAYNILTLIPNISKHTRDVCLTALKYSPPWALEFDTYENTDVSRAILAESLEGEHPMADAIKEGL